MIFYITIFDLFQGFCFLHVFQDQWSSKEKKLGGATTKEQIAVAEEHIFSVLNKVETGHPVSG